MNYSDLITNEDTIDNKLESFINSGATITSSVNTTTLNVDKPVNVLSSLNENTEISLPDMSGWAAGTIRRLDLYIQQDSTGGRTVTWATGWKSAGATLPTNTETANAVDRLVIDCIKDLGICVVGFAQADLS